MHLTVDNIPAEHFPIMWKHGGKIARKVNVNGFQRKTDFPADTQLQWSQGVRLPYWTKYRKFTKKHPKATKNLLPQK